LGFINLKMEKSLLEEKNLPHIQMMESTHLVLHQSRAYFYHKDPFANKDQISEAFLELVSSLDYSLILGFAFLKLKVLLQVFSPISLSSLHLVFSRTCSTQGSVFLTSFSLELAGSIYQVLVFHYQLKVLFH